MQRSKGSFDSNSLKAKLQTSAAEREALLLARQALVVLTPEVGSLRDAQQTRNLINAQIGAGRVLTVLNRANMPGALRLDLVKQGLGLQPEVVVPDLSKQLVRAANLGRPAIRDTVAFRRALTPLTQEISGVDLGRPAAARFMGLLRRS